jgi:hypothetical protein
LLERRVIGSQGATLTVLDAKALRASHFVEQTICLFGLEISPHPSCEFCHGYYASIWTKLGLRKSLPVLPGYI